MSATELLNHLSNFAAPYLWVGLCLGGLTAAVAQRGRFWRAWGLNTLVVAGAGLLTASIGLLIDGRDGTMTVYALAALAMGSAQCLLLWRGR